METDAKPIPAAESAAMDLVTPKLRDSIERESPSVEPRSRRVWLETLLLRRHCPSTGYVRGSRGSRLTGLSSALIDLRSSGAKSRPVDSIEVLTWQPIRWFPSE